MPVNPRMGVSANVKELMHSYGAKGAIGNTKPRDRKHAHRIAMAIALDAARRGRKEKH